MKKIFTFLLLMVIFLNSYSQKVTPLDQKNESFSSVLRLETQSFSVTSVYPNPVKEGVTIDLRSELSASVQISLFNILGTEVKKWESYYTSPGDQKIKIDLSFVKSGVYILKITNSNQVFTQVLKKN